MTLCLCGCGEEVKRHRIGCKPDTYVAGHKKMLICTNESGLCECGCGMKTTNKRRFVSGHNSKSNPIWLNREFSENHKQKLSESHMGQDPWNKGLTGVQEAWNKNIPHSEETKQRISEAKRYKAPWNLGVPQSEEHRIKNSEAHKGLMTGENNPNWKGGPRTELLKQRQSQEYKEWFRQVFKRNSYKCHRCNTGGALVAHHIINFSKLVDESQYLWDVNNGITLCKDCHKQFHYKYGTISNNAHQVFEFIYLNSNSYTECTLGR